MRHCMRRGAALCLNAMLLAGCGSDDPSAPEPPMGTLEIAVETGGGLPDADGYTVSVDEGQAQSIGVEGSAEFTLPPGDHEIELAALSFNCVVIGDNPRSVTVVAGGVGSTTFLVHCPVPLRNRILFTRVLSAGSVQLLSMNPDGTEQDFMSFGRAGDVSRDGVRVANVDNGDISVRFADNRFPVNLTQSPADDLSPAWSPGGTKIAFATDRDGDVFEVYVMDADGSNPVNLTQHPENDGSPAWSPDGTMIAFTTDRDGDTEVYVMNADGSNPVNLTQNAASDGSPAWSPDGAMIAFTTNRGGTSEVWVMDADGSNPTNVAQSLPLNNFDPAWSPDGTMLAVVAGGAFGVPFDIYVMAADGSNPVNLTQDDDVDVEPAWSP